MSRARLRFTPEAIEDLVRFGEHLMTHDALDPDAAVRAIRRRIGVLRDLPFLGRPIRSAAKVDLSLRELVVDFRRTGFVVLYRVESERLVSVLAVRHQTEERYH